MNMIPNEVMQQIEKQDVQARDAQGVRWVRCEYCGKIATEADFVIYGGRNRMNLGTCRQCMRDNPKAKEDIEESFRKSIRKQ